MAFLPSSHLSTSTYILALLLVLTYTTTASPLYNITLPLPLGTTNHGTPGLLCTPAKWTDIVLFYLFNYVAHAATVLTRPGERSDDFTVSVIGSLLFPALGLYRGIEAILCGAVFAKKDDLRKAARSGALCMVVRGREWRAAEGDEVRNAVFRRKQGPDVFAFNPDSRASTVLQEDDGVHLLTYIPPWLSNRFGYPVFVHRQIIHGTYDLPPGYRFVILPSEAQFTTPESPNLVVEVSATYNIVKALIALAQSAYALLTLYRSRGDQIREFGYAAFGLTVAPYAVMSIMNLLGNLCRPDYASLYMVENSIMDEARKRGGIFSGTVARVVEEPNTVCGCGMFDCDDAEDLHFAVSSTDTDTMTVSFGVSAPPNLYAKEPVRTKTQEKLSTSTKETLTVHTRTIKPLPPKLDYTDTKNDALLLVPSCNPVKTSTLTTPTKDASVQYRITALPLRQVLPPFKPKSYRPTFRFSSPDSAPPSLFRCRLAKYAFTTIIALTHIFIVAGMTGFKPGRVPTSESSNWKAFTMQWATMGAFSGLWWVLDQEWKEASENVRVYLTPAVRVLLYIVSASPAVGGFVVVGQMLARYGVCMWVGN